MNFVIVSMAAGAVVLMTTAVVTWPRRRTAHWAFSFLGLATAVSVWLIGYTLELSVFGLENKLFWAKIQYIGIAFTPVAWFVFANQFLKRNPRHLKSITIILSFLPIVTIILAFTNHHHHLLWLQNKLDESGAIPLLANEYGGWFWVHSTYSYLLILGGIGLFLRTINLHQSAYRGQSIILILAAAAPLTGNILYLTGNGPLPWFDPTPISFAVSALLIIWGVARLDLFDIVPIARRIIVENLPDGIVLLDEQNSVLDINQAGSKMLGKANQRIVGLNLTELTEPIAQKVSECKAIKETVANEEISVEQNGIWQHFSLRIRPLNLSGNEPYARILILRDISRRKSAEAGIHQRNVELQQLFTDAQEAQETAEKASKAKSELLAKVSHELRTPLGAILGYAEMLQEGVFGSIEEKQHHTLNRIIENSSYLNEQVNDLLDLSRLDRDKMKIETYPFYISDTLEQVHQRIQPVADAKDLLFSINLAPNMPREVVSNAVRIQQILVNLCTNAIKFTEAGQVHVTVEKIHPEHWRFCVSDTGKGIPVKDQKTIFLPFHQLQDSMVQGQSGIGLGLTIVKELVSALGGKIEVESKEHKGSTFIVTLPFRRESKA